MTKLWAIFQMKCPACWEGALFVNNKNPFSFNFEMHQKCPHCGEDLVREPGFYFGSMFLSYIMSGLFSLLVVGGLIIGMKVRWEYALAVLGLILILLYAFIYKFSRSLWIHLFVTRKK